MNKQTFLTLLATFALLFSFTFSCHAKGKDKAKHVVFIGLTKFTDYTFFGKFIENGMITGESWSVTKVLL